MVWKYKAILQNAFSNIPFGKSFNYFFQKYITRNLPVKDTELKEKFYFASKHISNFNKYGKYSLSEVTFYEFGAGWDLLQPLILYSLGVNEQIIIDINKLVKFQLVSNSIERISQLEIERKLNKSFVDKSQFIPLLSKFYGIDYRAPYDARKTNLEEKSIDCITSTNTLEHIPSQDIKAILKECHRILKDDGIMSFQIDYQDHYSYFDTNISVYNFIKFSDQTWNLFFNPSLHYQNRLRHIDYLNIFNEAGFKILQEEVNRGTPQDLKTIQTISINEKFSHYSLKEIAIRRALIVLTKKKENN